MPYAKNGDVNIYFEVEGEGHPLIFAHPGGGSIETWKRIGYVDALKDDYKCILIDSRGSGQSDTPHETSAYGTDLYKTDAADVIAVLDTLGIKTSRYYGYSRGSRAGYQLAVDYPDRFDGFILGNTSPFEWTGDWADFSKRWAEIFKLYLTDVESAVSKQEEYNGSSFSSEEKENFIALLKRSDKENDLRAIIAMGDIKYYPLTVDEVAGISIPCLIYCGDADGFHSYAKKAAEIIPNSTFISLPGLDHNTSLANIDTILPHVKEFLAKVS